jgi:hypothetical protein
MKQIYTIIFLLVTFNTFAAGSPTQPYEGWIETETDHFRIIYEDISTESVVEIIGFCEDVYISVTDFFDSYPEKITIVVHDRLDAHYGSYYPAPPHINMYVSAPSNPVFGAKVDNWLRFLLIHELTHYVNMTIEKGPFYQLSRVMGKSISSIPGGLMPGWAIEGIAVKLESDFTDGGRGNNPFFEMYSKALILEDKLFSWRQAAYSSYHPPLSRIYVAGYIINDYMARTYGNDVFVKIYRDYLSFPLLGFSHYVKKITGKSTSKIFTAMESELKDRYSNINSLAGRLLSPDEESNYYLPVISDAGWIVYRETADSEPALVLIDTDTKKETILVKTRLSDYRSFSASKDGNMIAFAALDIDGRHPAGLIAVSNLYLIDRTSSQIKKITFNSHLRQPALSPDGSRLIAVQKYGQYTCLVEVDSKSGNTTILFKKEKTSVFDPVFSMDGETIAFTVQNNSGRSIWIVNKEGIPASVTADIPGDDFSPTFRENGNIVYVSDMDGTPALYEIDLHEIDMNGIEIIKKIYKDPVGIFSGLVTDNNIIYSTYSFRGFSLRTTTYPEKASILTEAATFKNIQETEKSKTNDSTLNIPVYKTYRDTPKLILFTPIPFYIDPLNESKQIFGYGFTSYFQSILGKSIINTTVTMNTVTLQPGASLDLSYNYGPIEINYTLMQGYLPATINNDASQTTLQQLIFNFPILSNTRLGRSVYFGFFSGIQNNYSIISDNDFTFFSPDTMVNTEYSNNTYLINGIGFSVFGNKSRKDLIPPFKITSSTVLYNPISQDFLNQYAVKSTNILNLPAPIDHHVFRFAGRLSYSTIGSLNYLNNPRGFSLADEEGIQLTTAVDYLFTVAATDLPILGGLSLQGMSGSLHLEKIFRLQDHLITADEDLYSGIELILLGNYINVFESAGIGLSYRFSPNYQDFNLENMGIYIFIGTNSFE